MRTVTLLIATVFAAGAAAARSSGGCDEKCDAAYSSCMTGCQSNPACIDPCKRDTCLKIEICSECWAPCL
ncbi:Calreticulin/calnexin [Neofusicoccum parvum]|uniref:Uncharacterized protein n=2 Tax=Neofusicoccum parvum TaxID=310453 RepID=R1GVW3_BOTPV|nr:hypothetical protein UCRNP2_2998 [Neofusicoccum parvum UCRNP2]GME51275.1 Calreticulin/calnexin [Neofusicoccum parvum]GME66371.1 Calreticulin/calnexin [Neofusicoccum parvum]